MGRLYDTGEVKESDTALDKEKRKDHAMQQQTRLCRWCGGVHNDGCRDGISISIDMSRSEKIVTHHILDSRLLAKTLRSHSS